jgi:2-polyprenyl-3-methyl-5-hydroxy-6-metoxy-1,4-benzoquinol methylase
VTVAKAARVNLEHYQRDLAGQDDYWRLMAAPRFRVETLLGLVAESGASSLVDLGCGSGRLLAEVAERFPGMELAGIDLSPRLTERNAAERPEVAWHTLDLDRPLPRLPDLEGRFEAVVASEVIEHVDHPDVVLRNAAALAAPGALLLLSTQSGPLRETERRVGHVRHFSRDEMTRLLVETGWDPVRVWNAGFPFHDLSKRWANRDPDATMERFGDRPYGPRERLVCAALRLAFVFNSRRRGAQLFAVARRAGGPAAPPAGAAPPADQVTADGFASSWNTVGPGSVYTREQFRDWMEPVAPESLRGLEILELGFGNGSLLYHVAEEGPRRLVGVELGDTLEQTRRNLSHVPEGVLELHRADLTRVDLGRFDFVYCIGVLHHLEDPRAGFEAVLRHTRPGGRFHCWVYAHEGNRVIRLLVEPLRGICSRLPWWITKYGLALPLALPFFAYAKAVAALERRARGLRPLLHRLPLHAYCLWIAPRELRFFRHVAFDQLVAHRTRYLRSETLQGWLREARVEPGSAYLIFRNGNSWKLGGRRRRRP